MAEPAIRDEPVEEDLGTASSRLDASLLRYVLLYRSRMNMLDLDRQVRYLVGEHQLLRLPPGTTRSNLRYRAEVTMQFAVELALARPDVVNWINNDAWQRQMAIDAAYDQADRWARGLPPNFALADVPSGAPVHTYEALGAREDFFEYLWKKSLLEAERADAWNDDIRERAKAKEDAQRRLSLDDTGKTMHSIAHAVVQLLANDEPAADKALDKWREAARAGIAHAGFRPPPPELFDALLVGDRSLIGPVDGQPYRWRIDAKGTRLGTRPPPSGNRLRKAPMQAQWIDRAGKVLAQALGIGDVARVFAYLADGLSLLPTTPAWADVERALRIVEGRGTDKQAAAAGHIPEEERQMVDDFFELLGHHVESVERALCMAAFLAGLSSKLGGRTGPLTTRQALRLLSSGLRFAETESLQIAKAVETLWKSWPQRRDVPPWQADPLPLDKLVAPPPKSAPSELQARLEDAKALASRTTKPDILSALETAGWEAARRRLAHWCNTGRLEVATFAELCLAARAYDELPSLLLDPARMTLIQWSAILLADAPRWLSVIALQRLGVNTLGMTDQLRLLSVLERRPDGEKDQSLRRTAGRDGAWQPGGNAQGTVVLLLKPSSVRSENWVRPPTRGLVLLLTIDDVETLLLRKRRFFYALPRPVSVCVDALPEDAAVPRGLVRGIYQAVYDDPPWRIHWQRFLRFLRLDDVDDDRAAPVQVPAPDDLFDSARGDA